MKHHWFILYCFFVSIQNASSYGQFQKGHRVYINIILKNHSKRVLGIRIYAHFMVSLQDRNVMVISMAQYPVKFR